MFLMISEDIWFVLSVVVCESLILCCIRKWRMSRFRLLESMRKMLSCGLRIIVIKKRMLVVVSVLRVV